jgi:deazaflavin-dependent oxidoreductase (nitroreductase family)
VGGAPAGGGNGAVEPRSRRMPGFDRQRVHLPDQESRSLRASCLCAWVSSLESMYGPPVDNPARSKEAIEVDPQDYSHRTTYQPPAAWYRRLNWLGVPLTSLGLAPRDAVTLQVRGRRSGKPRRTPILRTPYRGQDYLVALAGESQWVRNVRAAAGQAVLRRRTAHRVHLQELPPEERPEVIGGVSPSRPRAQRRQGGRQAGPLLLRPEP